MTRIFLLGLLLFALLIGGLATFNAGWLELAIPLAVYLLVGLFFAPERINLSIERKLDVERAAPGQPVTVELLVTNHGATLQELLLRDSLPDFTTVTEGAASRVVLPGGVGFTNLPTCKPHPATRSGCSPSARTCPPTGKS
jgi:uncharacterized protein (DUF58 family)